MKSIVIGVDQSYADTGLAMAIDRKVVYAKSERFVGCESKREKRNRLCERLEGLIKRCEGRYRPVIVLEAVRLFSGATPFLSTSYIYGGIAMVGRIVDMAGELGVPVYWVESRSWKSAVHGTSKSATKKMIGVKDIKKVRSIQFALDHGYRKFIEKGVDKNGVMRYNDNVADAIGLSVCKQYGAKVKKLSKM